jgi:hypothetical protein
MLSNYNFNLNPYYDDFDEEKEFYRILFKPGFAVQARELTQLQTQLQNQIAKFGSHIFKDGSVVLNGNFFFYNVSYIFVSRNENITNLDNQTFTGQTSGAIGKVVKTEIVNDEIVKIYFTYLNGIIFQQNETVVCENTTTETIVDNENFIGSATAFSINEGIFFVNGHFVYCNPQTTIISENEPASCRVGLVATETIINPNQDTSLLDPAFGSYNYAAPGADRYSISLDLISFAYDPSIDDAEENSSEKFIELSRFVDGVQVTVNKLPIYSEIENTFARRTFDESGDYTVRAFGLKVKDHIYGNTENFLTLQIEPGKAYVKGYEFETISPTNINLPRALTTIEEDEFPIFVNYGNFLYITEIEGDLDYTGNRVIELHDNVGLINAAIGNATVKYIDFESRVSGNNVYKIYLDNINIFDSGNTVSKIRAIKFGTGPDFRAKVETNFYSNNVVNIQTSDNLTSILEIPKNYVKTLLINGGDTSYRTLRRFNNFVFDSGGTFATTTIVNSSTNQIFLGSGTLSASDTRELFLVTVTSSDDENVIPVGKILDYDTDGLRVNIVDENTAQIQCNSSVDFVATIYSKLVVSNAIQKNKTLTTDSITISGNTLTVANLSSTISLLKSDCIELLSVVVTSNTSEEYDFTSSYELFTGQTDTFYDHGYVVLKAGKVNPITALRDITISSVTINFSYYNHSSTAGFFSADSYPNYDEIPKYISSNGKTYDLRNCLDFRPRRADGSSTISGTLYAEPSSVFFCDFEYYIGRIDKLVLTKERKFNLVQGIPSDRPSVPVDLVDAMTLYVINVPPYTQNSSEVSFNYVENKRYTMRDIGKIEKRVERMEFYTTLSLLEKQARDEIIPSDIPTIDRFKNGILVDSFAGHSVGDVFNPDYQCSIDYNQRYLRAKFSSDSYGFVFNSGTNHRKSGDLITLNYTTETFINQPLFSRTVNLNPYLIFNWNGIVKLNPPSDVWIDTQVNPDVVVNLNGENDVYTVLTDNVENPTSTSGVRWSDWQTIIRGTPTTINDRSSTSTVNVEDVGGRLLQTTSTTTINNQTTTVTDQLARVGLSIQTGAVQTITKDLGTKIVDVSIVPFIRSRVIDYSAELMKPTTELIATFDNQVVTKFCLPAVEIILENANTVIQNSESIRLSTDSNVTGRVILTKRDRVFVREIGGVFRANNTINWILNGNVVGTSTISRIERPLTIRTNEKGDVAGSFVIPAGTFRTGERLFKLTDSLTFSSSTAASTKYVAQGLSQSTEKTLVSTRISTVSINPAFDTKADTSITTTTTVTSSTNVRDITPPPEPVIPPEPPKIQCARTQRGGKKGTFEFTLEFGENTGFCGISYDTDENIPDRFTITWDGNQYTSGFVGSNRFNEDLRALGLPTVVGPRAGNLLFNKTKTFPTQAKLVVDAPFDETDWTFRVICPEDNVTPPNEIIPPPETVPTVPEIIPPDPIFPINSGNVDLLITVPDYSFYANDTLTKKRTARIEVTATQTTARFARITNISARRTDTNTLLTVNKTSQDKKLDWKASKTFLREAISVDIIYEKPDDVTKPYDVELTASVELFNDSNYTDTSNVTDTGLGVGNVTRTTENRPSDPVAQTFFVSPAIYPNGIFIDSLDLYFRTKSDTLPVSVQIRPTVNGYPSSRDIVPFSIVTKEPENVFISDDASIPTNFKFEAPVYLPPGEHSFVALCDTTEYEIYTAVLGEFLLTDPTLRITEQPAIGSLFKSQNASTWTPVQEEDVMFRINKCVFNTGTTNAASVILHSDFPNSGNVLYDLLFADGEHLDFADTNINYFYKTTSENGVTDTSFTQYQLGSNVPMVSRRIMRSGNKSDLQFNIVMSTEDENVTPVIDLARLSSVLVQNIIDNASLRPSNFVITNYGEGYTGNANVIITSDKGSDAEAQAIFNSNTGKLEIVVTSGGSGYTGNVSATIERDNTATANAEVVVKNEIQMYPYGGNSKSRYFTRKVTLSPDFESLDLRVYLLANIPSRTSIKVYYKVAPSTSTIPFEQEIWREMVLDSAGAFTETGFADYKYKTSGDTALPSGERFRTFAIKIVMLSADPVRVPIIRDLRAIALDV